MKVLFDTNVVLDVLLDRHPYSACASHLMARVERGGLVGIIGATTLTTIFYLVRKASDRTTAVDVIRQLLAIFEVASVDRKVLESALAMAIPDFEDAVLHEAGRFGGADLVVTRDLAGFRQGSLRVYTPGELLAAIETT